MLNFFLDYSIIALTIGLMLFFFIKAAWLTFKGNEMGLGGDDLLKRYLYLKKRGVIK